MVEAVQNQNVCNQYVKNPYICPNVPSTNIVIPQGQVYTPSSPSVPVRTINQMPQNQQAVSYNQVMPYINTGSSVFQPSIKTLSGKSISNIYTNNLPITKNEAKLVYQGPVTEVNPQVSPIEQIDAQIEKDFRSYFKTKKEENEELRKALDKTFGEEKNKKWPTVATVLGIGAAVFGIYKFRGKIPILKRFCK